MRVWIVLWMGLGALAARDAVAQGPDAAWRTLATPHFRLHYPAPYEAWTQRAAAWLEVLRQRDIAEIGFTPTDVVDVVVSDPRADANGEAFPFRGWPRLVLWTSPAPAESEIGTYRDAIEDLTVHEEAHLVHLLRPSRNALLGSLLPVSSIALGPRWLVEGYATVVEGRMTGSGRPNGDLRAAILRRWAQAGRLPTYGALASDSHDWQGLSMAYLMGSAFLEWLDERGGAGSLRKLWARLTARTGRGFDEAFSGIWGNVASSLYDRFRAELTWRAMEAEKRVQAVGPLALREGPLWQELTWSTGAPAVSRDASRIAVVRRSRDRPAEIVIWPTAPDTAAEKRWQDEQARQLAKDPQDVAAVRSKPLPRQPLFTWTAHDGAEPAMPRFMPDGRALLFVRFMPDREGFLHPDLFTWQPESGAVRRLTAQADLRDPDPSPDGTWAVAVRNRYGFSQLVTVDLATGAAADLTAPSLDRVYDRPRLSPDGRRVAFAVHEDGTWQLAVIELDGRRAGAEIKIAAPGVNAASAEPLVPAATAGAPMANAPTAVVTSTNASATGLASTSVSSPSWSPDGTTLYAVVGRGGFIDLYAFAAPGAASDLPAGLPQGLSRSGASPGPSVPGAGPGLRATGQPPRALTRTQGAALAPVPTADGKALFYLSLEPYGLDLHCLDLTAARSPLAEVAAPPDLAPAVRPAAPPAPPPIPSPLVVPPPVRSPPDTAALPPGGAGLPYGAGRQELLPLIGGQADSAGSALELGLRSGDLLGRLDILALGAVGSPGAQRGGTVAGVWRGAPVELGVQVFDAKEDVSRQAYPVTPPQGAADELDLERRGVAATTLWSREGAGHRLDLSAGLVWQRLLDDDGGAGGASESLAALRGSYRLSRRFGLWRLGASVSANGLGGRPAGTAPFPASANANAAAAGGGPSGSAGAGGAGGVGAASGGGGDSAFWRYGGQAGFAVSHRDVRLGVLWRRDSSHGVTRVHDLYQVGGGPTDLLPAAAQAERIASPALPAAVLLGTEHEEERIELDPGLSLPLFWERHRVWGAGGGGGGARLPGSPSATSSHVGAPAEITLAGFEYRFSLAPWPLVRLPGLEVRAGAARVFSDPLRDRYRFWLLSAWSP